MSMLTVIDITEVARRFRLVRLANYFMVVGCGTWLVGQLLNAPNVTAEWIPVVSLLWTGLIVNVWAGLITAGAIEGRMWRCLYVSLPLLAICGAAAAISLFRSMPADIDAHSNPGGNAIFVACVLAALFAASGVLALAAVISLDRIRIDPWSVRLRELIDSIESAIEAPAAAERGKATSRLMGLLCATLAALILVGQHYVPDAVWQPNAQVLSLLALSGWSLVFHARRCFLPDASSLLEADRRSRIVLLRSFEDDERHHYLASELSVIDFGLETRLANHFGRFGPFVAIGSPRDPTPRPGASTIRLPDAAWQRVVQDWMDKARYIILLSGTTRWVNWELSQVIERGLEARLILMFPRRPWWLLWRRVRSENARLIKLRDTLAGTPWVPNLALIDRPQDIRALVLQRGGGVLLIRSRPRNRDSYHLAVLLAQRQMLIDNAPGGANA